MTEPMGVAAFMATAKPTSPSHSGNDAVAVSIASELREIVRDAAMRAPRQVQVHLGPSELGVECDRQVVHKLLQLPDTNHVVDPWPSIVGTAVHAWLDNTFTNARPAGRWMPERKVAPTDDHPGTADLYDAANFRVIDHKGIHVDTDIPAPSGWKRHGDLCVGDYVFGADGAPCRVVKVYPVQVRDCYRVVFDDGASIVTDDVQQFDWLHGRSDATATRTMSVVEARSVMRDRRGQSILRLPVARPLWGDPAPDLPVDPYVLGCWLGDGCHSDGTISKPDPELFDNIVARGYTVGAPHAGGMSRTVHGLSAQLQAAGLQVPYSGPLTGSHSRLVGNKRVPDEYLRMDYSGRLALLRGLMDTDGTWNRKRNQAVFTTTDAQLAAQVDELVETLGWKARTLPQTAHGFGKTTTAYHVAFTPTDANPFSLPRKAELVRRQAPRRAHYRIVRSIERVESVPTMCIDVDSPDHLYLAGRDFLPVHNCLGSSTHDKLRTQGPPRHYYVQLLLYALGYIRAGYRVDSIAIAAWPRTGSSLAGLYVWHHVITADDWRLVEQVLAETKTRKDYAALVEAGAISIAQVPRTPTDGCYFCSYYRPESARDGGPGCPGTTQGMK